MLLRNVGPFPPSRNTFPAAPAFPPLFTLDFLTPATVAHRLARPLIWGQLVAAVEQWQVSP